MAKPLILIIEDDETVGQGLRFFFEGKDYSVMQAFNGKEGLECALREIPDTILLDLRLPDMNGIEILQVVKDAYPEISVIVMTGYGDIKEAVAAIKLGAEFYFQKPVDLDEIAVIVEKGLGIKQMRQEAVLSRRTPYQIIGRSAHVQGLIHMINLLADNPSTTVLITGETGTGKELVARNIHTLSIRGGKPFVAINCSALPDSVVESELFGYEAGAFTDAKKTKKGLIELADGGTLFLDEIGDMSQGAQAKILRVLESRTLKRLGGTRDISVDVRVVAATNKDVETIVKTRAFREDLFYRLNVMPLALLPLRKRPEDIPLIAEFLLQEIKRTIGKREIGGFTREAVDMLSSYPWPGNVRELRNVIERAAILCLSGDISVSHLILPDHNKEQPSQHGDPLTLGELECSHIQDVLKFTGGNKTRAAQVLGVARSTLNEKLKHYHIQ